MHESDDTDRGRQKTVANDLRRPSRPHSMSKDNLSWKNNMHAPANKLDSLLHSHIDRCSVKTCSFYSHRVTPPGCKQVPRLSHYPTWCAERDDARRIEFVSMSTNCSHPQHTARPTKTRRNVHGASPLSPTSSQRNTIFAYIVWSDLTANN